MVVPLHGANYGTNVLQNPLGSTDDQQVKSARGLISTGAIRGIWRAVIVLSASHALSHLSRFAGANADHASMARPLRPTAPVNLISAILLQPEPVAGHPATQGVYQRGRRMVDANVTLPETQACNIKNFQPDAVKISSEALCVNSTFEAGARLASGAELVQTHVQGDADLGAGARLYRSQYSNSVTAGPGAHVTDLRVFGDALLGVMRDDTARHKNNAGGSCESATGINGVSLPIGQPPWEIQGDLTMAPGVSLELLRPVLDQISRLVLGQEYDLRVFPGSVTAAFDNSCTQLQVSANKVNRTTSISVLDPQFRPLELTVTNATNVTDDINVTNSENLSPYIQQVGDLPHWALKEGEIGIRDFNPAMVMKDVRGKPLSYRLLGASGQHIPWAFMDLERSRIVFNPISGLLGDDESEIFHVLLRGIDEEGLISEKRGNVTVIRLADNCELMDGVIGESLNPIGGLTDYIKCQSEEAAKQKSQRAVLLEMLGKTLGFAVAIGSSIFVSLTTVALLRDRAKRNQQGEVDNTLSRILYHFTAQDMLGASKDWSGQVLERFKDLHVFPNQRGALRHVQQYRNDIYKILGYALPNLQGTNQDFSAKLLRNFLPISQKLKYGLVRNTVGWCGVDGSVEDLRNVIYSINYALTSVRYAREDVAGGEPADVTEDNIAVEDLVNPLASRMTILNLPFLAANKVSHFWPVDAASAEMKIWANAFYSLVHCNMSSRKESKEMDVLARSDMARMLRVLVGDAKRHTSELAQQFYDIGTEVNKHVEAQAPDLYGSEAFKTRVRREMLINARVNALMHMILDHEISPKNICWDLVCSPVKLNLASRFIKPTAIAQENLPAAEARHVHIRTQTGINDHVLAALEGGELVNGELKLGVEAELDAKLAHEVTQGRRIDEPSITAPTPELSIESSTGPAMRPSTENTVAPADEKAALPTEQVLQGQQREEGGEAKARQSKKEMSMLQAVIDFASRATGFRGDECIVGSHPGAAAPSRQPETNNWFDLMETLNRQLTAASLDPVVVAGVLRAADDLEAAGRESR